MPPGPTGPDYAAALTFNVARKTRSPSHSQDHFRDRYKIILLLRFPPKQHPYVVNEDCAFYLIEDSVLGTPVTVAAVTFKYRIVTDHKAFPRYIAFLRFEDDSQSSGRRGCCRYADLAGDRP